MDDKVRVHSLGGFQAKRTGPIEDVVHPFLVEVYDDPVLHRQQVLPGAKRAVPTVQVETWQQQGLSEDEMVALINERWEHANEHRLREFVGWRDGPRVEQLREHEERQRARFQALAELEARLIAEKLAEQKAADS